MAECHIGLFAFGFIFYFSWNREPAFELFFKSGLSCKKSFSFSLGIQAADLSLAFGLLSPFSGLQYLFSQGFKPRFSSLFALKLAFPHSDDGPAQSLQMCLSHLITVPVPCNLGLPKFRIRLRFGCISTSLVPVPEASVHHYGNTPPWQGDVRLSRKFPVLQPESETPGVQSPPHQNLRPGVLPANTGHTTMSLTRGELICHRANITLFLRSSCSLNCKGWTSLTQSILLEVYLSSFFLILSNDDSIEQRCFFISSSSSDTIASTKIELRRDIPIIHPTIKIKQK